MSLNDHFARVERHDAHGWIAFPDRSSVESYVEATRTFFGRALPPEFDRPLRVRRAPVVFAAERA